MELKGILLQEMVEEKWIIMSKVQGLLLLQGLIPRNAVVSDVVYTTVSWVVNPKFHFLSEERTAQCRWTDHILPYQMKREEVKIWWGKERGGSDGEQERWTMSVKCVFE